MKNPSSWSVTATLINEAAEEWYNKDGFDTHSLGVHIESKLKVAGLLVDEKKFTGQPNS